MMQRMLILLLIFSPSTIHPMKQIKTYVSKVFSSIGARVTMYEEERHTITPSQSEITQRPSEKTVPKIIPSQLYYSETLQKRDTHSLVPQKLERRAPFKADLKKNSPVEIPTITIYPLTPTQLQKLGHFKRASKKYFKK